MPHSPLNVSKSHSLTVSLMPDASVLVCPASFKGTLSANQAAEAMAEGARDALPKGRVILLPLSDGGEGLVQVLGSALNAKLVHTKVQGPLAGQQVDAVWALTPDRKTAVIEMASAAGLPLVPTAKRDPGLTTTRGVGELILTALDERVSRIILGLGGSATNDGGAGMASALGYRFLDAGGSPLPDGGSALTHLDRIDASGKDPRIDRTVVVAACDVTNPLTGPDGAAMVYGAQKGGARELLAALDEAMVRLAGIVKRDCGLDVTSVPGAGAAGGMGGGVIAFLHGTLSKGIEVVLDAVHFEDRLHGADLVLTGEGRLDDQTRRGKVIAGVLSRTSPRGTPVIAIAGTSSFEGRIQNVFPGLTEIATLVRSGVSVERAMKEASILLRERTAEVLRTHLCS